MSEGLITGLDLTLRRLSSIENNFNRILGTDESVSSPDKSAAKEFKAILDEKMGENKETIEKTTFKNSSEDIENLINKYAQ